MLCQTHILLFVMFFIKFLHIIPLAEFLMAVIFLHFIMVDVVFLLHLLLKRMEQLLPQACLQQNEENSQNVTCASKMLYGLCCFILLNNFLLSQEVWFTYLLQPVFSEICVTASKEGLCVYCPGQETVVLLSTKWRVELIVKEKIKHIAITDISLHNS